MAERGREACDDDVVEYSIFLHFPDDCSESNRAALLQTLRENILAQFSDLLVTYIWQSEPFNLAVLDETRDVPAHLHGRTHYGDNVEDEWFIVWMICQATKANPGLVARIHDEDGEFLLIESANHLDKWMKPETAGGRVYVSDGALHIIPPPQSPAHIGKFPANNPTAKQAIHCISEYGDLTIAKQAIQDDIQRRLKEFPESCVESAHHAHCYIPAAAAAILSESPSLIAPAVQAFYCRDAIDLKQCRIMTHFRPGTRVMTRVKFTRCLYAQLLQQKFNPDRRSDWNIPSPQSAEFKAYDLGMKMAYGFEILCSRGAKRQQNVAPEEKITSQDARWKHYSQTLKDKGYFRGEIEGSKLHTELSKKAWQYFAETVQNPNKCYGLEQAGSRILRMLTNVEYNIEELRSRERSLLPADEEDWMTLTPEQLEATLMKAAGKGIHHQTSAARDTFDLSQISESMKAFINKTSGLEGVEFPEEGGGMIQSMQKIFDFQEHDSDSSSSMSEYGSDDEPVDAKGKKEQNKMDEYMALMDRELYSTKVGQSFEQKVCSDDGDIGDFDDEFKPVDVDVTVVKNLLDSYSAQQGKPGPGSNILKSMGVHIPDDENAQ